VDPRTILTITILIVALIFLLARLIGPNLFIGFRIGYTMIDERVWKKTHELGAVIFLISSIIYYIITIFFRDTLAMIAIFVSIMLLSTIILLYKSIEYAEKITGFEPTLVKEIKPLEPLKAEHADLVSYVLLIIFLIAFTYSALTLPETIAVRFDLSGNPVAWQDKTSFLISMLTLTLTITIVIKAVTHIGMKHPIVFYSGLIARKWGKRALFLLTVYSLQVSEIIITFSLLVITIYNLQSPTTTIMPTALLITTLTIMFLIPILLIHLKRKKRPKSALTLRYGYIISAMMAF